MEHWRDYRYTIISRSVEEDLLKFRHIMGAERYLSSRLDREMIAYGRDSKKKRDKASARKVAAFTGTKSVVLGVTGSIAAYKAAELASLLVKQGHDVFVVMTQGRDRIHHAAHFADALQKSGHDQFLRRKGKLATRAHRAGRSRGPARDRARDGAHHRRAGARPGRSSAGRDRARDPRADSARAGHERKNVGAPGDTRKMWRR